MEGSLKELAQYRMERAKEMLIASEENLKIEQYRTSLNKSSNSILVLEEPQDTINEINLSEGSFLFLVKSFSG